MGLDSASPAEHCLTPARGKIEQNNLENSISAYICSAITSPGPYWLRNTHSASRAAPWHAISSTTVKLETVSNLLLASTKLDVFFSPCPSASVSYHSFRGSTLQIGSRGLLRQQMDKVSNAIHNQQMPGGIVYSWHPQRKTKISKPSRPLP